MEKIKDFNSKLDKNAQLISVLSQNLEILNKVSRFHDHYQVLTANHERAISLHDAYTKDITSLVNTKNDRRSLLIDNATSIVRVLQAFAIDKKKKSLQFRLEHLTSEFFHDCSDMELVKISKKIWLTANQYGGFAITFNDKIKFALNPENSNTNIKFEKKYGLIPEMIHHIEEATINFIDTMVQYQKEKSEKEHLASEMKTNFRQSKKLIANKIDKFAVLFEKKNPQFFNQYVQAREKQNKKSFAEFLEPDMGVHDTHTSESEEK